jgi:2,4-dichlorophenol 6-monooxygenase
MNQRYKSSAVVTDGQMEPAFELDAELHYQPTTWPGARLPHAWLYDAGWRQALHARSGRPGQVHGSHRHQRRAWATAAEKVAKALGIDMPSMSSDRAATSSTTMATGRGPARSTRRLRAGAAGPACRLARRRLADNPEAELTRVLSTILHRDTEAARQAAQ